MYCLKYPARDPHHASRVSFAYLSGFRYLGTAQHSFLTTISLLLPIIDQFRHSQFENAACSLVQCLIYGRSSHREVVPPQNQPRPKARSRPRESGRVSCCGPNSIATFLNHV